MELELLRTTIKDSQTAYYNTGTPLITDGEYDMLLDELRLISPNDELLTKIGDTVPDNSPLEKATHKIAMTSLNKAITKEDLLKWHTSINSPKVTASIKLDGCSLSLEYEDGKLISGITRGDGITGENITRNVVKMKNVKTKLPNDLSISLRGEIVITQSDFEELNKLMVATGETPYKNKRNAVSGICRKLDGTNCEYLSVVYYDTTYETMNGTERFIFLDDLGLPTALIGSNLTIENVISIYDNFESELRARHPIEMDGIVVEVQDSNTKKELGMLYGNPNGAIAFKFTAMKAEAPVVDVDFRLGNTNRITPVAIIKPTEISGVTVTQVTLHNIDFFNLLQLRKGSIVQVARNGDVIPYLCKVISHSDNPLFEIPSHCPECNGNTKIEGKFLICDNPSCSGKVSGDVNVWVKKIGLKGIADATIEILCAKELIRNAADLYSLTEFHLYNHAGFGKKQSKNIYDIINSKKEVTLPEFIGGLNLNGFGSRMTELLIEAGYDTLDAILKLTSEELVAIKGIEIKTATTFLTSINSKTELIKELLEEGITIKQKEVVTYAVTSSKLAGKVFVFTGKIDKIDSDGNRYTRTKMEELVYANGGSCEDSISKSVTTLVQADVNSTSSKSVKAKKMGVQIMSEAEFFNLIGI